MSAASGRAVAGGALRLHGPFLTLVLVLLLAVSASTIAGFAGIRSLDSALREAAARDVRRVLLTTHVRRLFRSELVLMLELDKAQHAEERAALETRRRAIQVERAALLVELRALGVPGQAEALRTLERQHETAAGSGLRQAGGWEAAVASILAGTESRLLRAVREAESRGRTARLLLVAVSTSAAGLALALGTIVLRRVGVASRALSSSEQQFRCVVESAPSLLAILSPRRRLDFLPARGPAFLGVSGDRLKQDPLCWVHPDGRAEIEARFAEVAAPGGGTAAARLRAVRDDGSTWHAAVSLTPLRDERAALRGVVLQILDVTQQHQAEEARQVLEEQLRQSQKMESVGRLAGGVAHDFNNLLTAISGYASLAQMARGGDEKMRECIEGIATAADRASTLTRQLLAFSRKHVIAPVPTALDELIRRLERMLERVIGEDVKLSVRTEPGLGRCLVDPNQVEQVILNLAINGRDAMPNGGTLLIEARNATLGREYVERHPEAKEGRYVLLEVRDSGHGMSPEVRSRLFEPFFTTKPRGQGTGLGLSVVYGTVKQHGGSIHVDSEPGRGTTVSIYWPRIEAGVDTPAATEARERSSAGGNESILLVEDDPLVRDFTLRALSMHGYRVLPASSAEEADRLLGDGAKPPDLLLTDVILPDRNGRLLAQELRRRWPDLRVLFCSGYSDRLMTETGRLPPGVDYLPKPYDTATLVEKVRSVLDAAAVRRARK